MPKPSDQSEPISAVKYHLGLWRYDESVRLRDVLRGAQGDLGGYLSATHTRKVVAVGLACVDVIDGAR